MKLLVVRHPTSGSVSVIDAHCFHMGAALAGGDIEDVAGHSCIVCPAHRYRIDLATGCKVDTDLEGRACAGAEQKQRVYRVHSDGEFIWVDLPDARGPPLASDYYNRAQQQLPPPQQPAAERPGSQNYGLFGAAGAARPGEAAGLSSPVQPYSGYSGWPVVPAEEGPIAASPPLVLSQEAPRSPAPVARINFPAAKVDPPHIARRKAATAAILAKSYRPPTADSTPTQFLSKPQAPAPAAAQGARQQTLLEMSWGARPVAVNDDAMDMN
jgi:nitrite reductase/ring-hydroxylating ferredoxin subunit